MGLDLIVFGDTAIDNFYEVKNIPQINEASDIIKGRRFYGGMGANTAVCAKKLGLDVGLVSVIGTDAQDYREYMNDLGIKLFLKGIFGDTTKSLFFKNDDESISFFYRGVTEQLDDLNPQKEFGRNLPKDVKAVYMARTYLQMQKKVIEQYSDSLKVYNPGYGIFKFENVPRIFRRIMNESDVIIVNHHELNHLKKIGYKIKIKPWQTLIVTKGSMGSSVYVKNTKINIPIYKTDVVDAAGAGDAFNAGFIKGMLDGYDIYEAAKIGNVTSSFVVEAWGCQTNIPKMSDVIGRYKKIR